MFQSIFAEIIQNEAGLSDLENKCLALSQNRSSLLFPKKIESLFKKSFFDSEKYKNILFILIGLFFFNIFAFMDKLMVNDIYIFAWKLRFFLITPASFISVFVIYFTKRPFVMDFVLTFILILAAASLLFIINKSGSSLVAQYHAGIFVVCLAGLLIFKISFFYKIFFSLLLIAVHLLFFEFNQNIHYYSKINIITVLFSLIIVSLIAAAERESNYRKAFIFGLLREITTYSLEKKNKFLKKISNRDELTGLSNRRFFKKHITRLITPIGNGLFPIALLYADLDNFKVYNDTYGHLNGDECLKKVAGILKKFTKRKLDLPARFGGEEFLIILPFTGRDEAVLIAEKIRKGVEDLQIKNKNAPFSDFITLSIGISLLNKEGSDVETAINQADQALYKSKNSGKNTVSFFDAV